MPDGAVRVASSSRIRRGRYGCQRRCVTARRLVFVRPPSLRMSTPRSLFLALPLTCIGAFACADDSRAVRMPPRDVAATHAPAETVSAALLLAQRGDTGTRRATPKPRVLTDAEQRVADGIVFAPIPTERFV